MSAEESLDVIGRFEVATRKLAIAFTLSRVDLILGTVAIARAVSDAENQGYALGAAYRAAHELVDAGAPVTEVRKILQAAVLLAPRARALPRVAARARRARAAGGAA